MKDFFADIYEIVFELVDPKFPLITDTMDYNYGYVLLGVSFVIVPLVMFASFYLLWKYPYGRFWHWFLWLVITSLLTSVISWSISYNEIILSSDNSLNKALNDTESGYKDATYNFLMNYALCNGVLCVITACIYSVLLKQISKIQIHLPF